MEKKKIHIDTDIGADVDDLCAIAYLLKRPDVTVTGITTWKSADAEPVM